MKNNEIHLTFPAMSENEAFARMTASAFAAQLDPTVEEITDIRTAVSEAVTNAIIHGYDSRPMTVYMDAYIEGQTLRIIIRDDGRGIEDVEQAMQPFYTSMPNADRSGMGFAVMQAFMDEVHVESKPGAGTCVTLIKRISRDEDNE